MQEKKGKYQQFNKFSDLLLRDKVRYMIQPSDKSEGTMFLLLFCYKEPQKIWETHIKSYFNGQFLHGSIFIQDEMLYI